MAIMARTVVMATSVIVIVMVPTWYGTRVAHDAGGAYGIHATGWQILHGGGTRAMMAMMIMIDHDYDGSYDQVSMAMMPIMRDG